jgi:hypothetical protein
MIFFLCQLPGTSPFKRMSSKMWSKILFPSKGCFLSRCCVVAQTHSRFKLLYRIFFFASHSNLSDDPSCISKDRGTNGGAIFDTNSGIQPPQLFAPVEEDLLAILLTSDSTCGSCVNSFF